MVEEFKGVLIILYAEKEGMLPFFKLKQSKESIQAGVASCGFPNDSHVPEETIHLGANRIQSDNTLQ